MDLGTATAEPDVPPGRADVELRHLCDRARAMVRSAVEVTQLSGARC